MNSDKKIRVGIIGYGNMGMKHAKNIFKGEVKSMVLSAV